jgi:sulfite dehydrogenase (quinone) subunit SoeC
MMHPAPSLIAFTTLSGLGFGLLIFLGLGLPPVTGWVAFVFFAVAYALAGGGLLASTLHLGHPERAIKAFTQWRSSWLSREAWMSVAALAVNGPLRRRSCLLRHPSRAAWPSGRRPCVAAVLATAMIYTQLKTVPRWHHWTTPALFLLYAAAGGALLVGQQTPAVVLLLLLALGQAWVWIDGDTRFARSGSTLASATGLSGGAVRAFEPPHTGGNYLLREMVHVVGRRHARKLRAIALVLACFLPAMLLLPPASLLLSGLAVLSHLAGALIARWLFFAEAEHVVGLYYGRRGESSASTQTSR